MAALASMLRNPPSQKLARDKFLFWKALVMPKLHGAHVTGLLDGIDVASAENHEVEEKK
jgi:hypothetical protein